MAPEARNAAYRGDTAAKVGGTWLFRDQVRFAYVTTVPVTRANAAAVYPMAEDLLHFSPEPRVIEPLIESAVNQKRGALRVVVFISAPGIRRRPP